MARTAAVWALAAAIVGAAWAAEAIEGRWINEGNPTEVTGKANTETLRFLQVLWRHGDRTPAMLIPTDKENGEETWPEGLGELTTKGMAQQLRLGRFLRERYADFLSARWDRNEAYIRSSDYNRTLMSAQANLAGLFPPTKDEEFSEGLGWRPIPVHTVPKEEDVQLHEEIKCPTAEAESKRVFAEFPRAVEVARKHAELFRFLENVTGLSPFGLDTIWRVYDPLFAESCHNDTHAWPSWMNESLWAEIEEVYDDSSRFTFHTHLLRRLRGGPLVHEVLDRFAEKAGGGLQKMRTYAYSAHDSTLAAILATFGIFPVHFPFYATALLLELHERKGEFYVEMYHKNATDSPRLFRHEMEGCPSPCKLATLKAAMAPYEPADWRAECGLPTQENIARYVVAIAVLAVSTLVLFVILSIDVLLKYRKRHEHNEVGQRLLLTDDES